MSSTVRSRPSHYETLGLKPGASSEEIERAFAREIGALRPRAFGGVAEVSLAYATLRDPAKRRAYDAAIGVAPKPKPSYSLTSQAIGATFLHASPRPAGDALPQRARQPVAEPPASFIAASLRTIADAEPRALPPQPKQALQPAAEAQPSADQHEHLVSEHLDEPAEDERPDEVEDGAIDWKRAGIGVGALVLLAVITGAWAGWEAGNDVEAPQPEAAVKMALPPAKPFAAAASAPGPAAPTPRAVEERTERPTAAELRALIEPSPPPAEALEPQRADVAQAEPAAAPETPTESTGAEAPPSAPAVANLGLPNRVVARTIERIGYACGAVASTTAVAGGAPGVFKVTCTSGNAYQARPVGGRYRFRRWGRE